MLVEMRNGIDLASPRSPSLRRANSSDLSGIRIELPACADIASLYADLDSAL